MAEAHSAAQELRHARTRIADDLADTLRRHGEALPDTGNRAEFGAAFDHFGTARVVLLGEATHGTAPWQRNPARYAIDVIAGRAATCQNEVVSQLQALLA